MTGSYLSDPQHSQAVLIGVYDHQKPSDLESIDSVDRNLIGLADALIDPEIWGLPREHVATVRQPTTSAEIFDAVIAARDQATDTLLVYYAGHGLLDPDDERELHLALPTSRNLAVYTAFRYELLRRYLSPDKVKADKVVIILDCCFSGLAALGPMSAAEELADLASAPGRCVLTASAATKIAMAPPGETYTAFTGVLLKLLTDGVAYGSEFLDLQTLYEAAYMELEAQSRPLPQLGSQGSPGQICIAKNRSVDVIPIPIPDERHRQPTPTPRPRRPAGVPNRMVALVREFLLEPPQPSGLRVMPRDNMHRGRPDLRALHGIENGEDIIAIWNFKKTSFLSSSENDLVFTSRGIRMFGPRRVLDIISFKHGPRVHIPYGEFNSYKFTCSRYERYRQTTQSGGGYTAVYYYLNINGPTPWGCPGQDSDVQYLVNDLNYIRELVAGR